MLVVSKFRDYYDVGMKHGTDKSVVYERETVEVKKGFASVTRYLSENRWHGCVLAFCGKFYPFVYHATDYKVDRIIWDLEEALRVLPKTKRRYYWDDYLDTEIGIKKFFDRKYPELEKLFHEYRTPVFGFEPSPARSYSWRSDGPYRALVLNPNLKNLQFYKVKDPITAYQEIYMFMSGVIGAPPKPTKPIDDKVMAASKGHDGQYSFKKPPGKRGKNKWR